MPAGPPTNVPTGTVVGGVAAHLATRGINGAYTYLTTPSGLEPGWQSTRGAALPRRGVSYYGSGHRPPQTPVVVNINATHPRYVHSTYNTGPHSPTVIKITPKTPSYTPRRTSTRHGSPKRTMRRRPKRRACGFRRVRPGDSGHSVRSTKTSRDFSRISRLRLSCSTAIDTFTSSVGV